MQDRHIKATFLPLFHSCTSAFPFTIIDTMPVGHILTITTAKLLCSDYQVVFSDALDAIQNLGDLFRLPFI
jgi:hypothetical protein